MGIPQKDKKKCNGRISVALLTGLLLLSLGQTEFIQKATATEVYRADFDLLKGSLTVRVGGYTYLDPVTTQFSASVNLWDLLEGKPFNVYTDLTFGWMVTTALSLNIKLSNLFGKLGVEAYANSAIDLFEYGSYKASIGAQFGFDPAGNIIGTSRMTFTGDDSSFRYSYDFLAQEHTLTGWREPPQYLMSGRIYWYYGSPEKWFGDVYAALTDLQRKIQILTSAVFSIDPDDPSQIDGSGTTQETGVGVGGFVVPVDKLGLLAPYFGLASTILVATVATSIYAKHVKRRKEK